MHDVIEGQGLWDARLFRFDSLPSTNTWALAHADSLRHGDVVWARRQTAGRGRFDRVWVSPGDGCLTLSVLLSRPHVGPLAPNLGQIAAVGVARTLATYGLEPRLKWPNDVMVDDRKIAGILAESKTDSPLFVLGIGLNVNLGPEDLRDPRIERPATAVSLAAGQPYAVECVRAVLIAELQNVLDETRRTARPGLIAAWTALDDLAGREVEALAAGRVVRGRYLGLDDEGAIRVLDSRGEEHTLWAADVDRIRGRGPS
ncbi:MAG: biotin--[acetyl-CoA-carboxylase] ligase [Kiritimatiellae bacterium]|nr:biotin--[acetyl-CoA-carboxylase] ligase [Kiritimatiellia bacterium]